MRHTDVCRVSITPQVGAYGTNKTGSDYLRHAIGEAKDFIPLSVSLYFLLFSKRDYSLLSLTAVSLKKREIHQSPARKTIV